MAIIDEKTTKAIKERFEQLARLGFPFDPVGGVAIGGMNLKRLQQGMEMFRWEDPRFVSEIEANRNGWEITKPASSVTIRVRDQESGSVEDIALFNAKDVSGIPSLAAMLAMSEEAIAKMQGHSIESVEHALDDELQMNPVRELSMDKSRSSDHERELSPGKKVVETQAADEHAVDNGRFAVMALYWRDGLHNAEGIALANEINSEIRKTRSEQDKEAIARLMQIYPNAKRFGLSIVPESQYLNDPHLKANHAEPRTLLDGAFVRDKNGAYRPKEGGRTVLEDKGDSLVLKSKDKNGYAAAMELAIAKGWTSIELKGKPAMLADAWLEAKLKGLNVVNYSPSKEDLAKFTERLAKDNALKEAHLSSKTMVQAPEQVVMRPFIDANGQNKVAIVTYSVCSEQVGQEEAKYDNPKDAAKAFNAIAASCLPSVFRTVTRADGEVDSNLMVAGTSMASGASKAVKTADSVLDAVFSEALDEVMVEEKALASLAHSPAARDGTYSGMILGIEGGYAIQKVGRDPDKVVRHDIQNLSRLPGVGVCEDIAYDKLGKGILKALKLEHEHDHESSSHEIAR